MSLTQTNVDLPQPKTPSPQKGGRPQLPLNRRVRRRLQHILELGSAAGAPGIAFEVFLVVLIVGNVVAVTLESVPAVGAAYRPYFIDFEIFSVVVFTIEYGLRLWVAPEDPRFADNP
ncbi:MAG TPA: hypothetical protein VK759_00075, partial [Rhizomicrobium sp.]|nr:hypothetical protein [Rhizomicrobium sp.]